MLNYLLPLFLTIPNAATLKVAVVDTGLDIVDTRISKHLCAKGHKDFTNTTLKDEDGHGTHVVGSIIKNASNSNYCLVILKYFSLKLSAEEINIAGMAAFLHADLNVNADIVVFAGIANTPNNLEEHLIKTSKAIFIVAAGNEGKNIDLYPTYPAGYHLKNVIVVGNFIYPNKPHPDSNFGKSVTVWEVGTNIWSFGPNNTNVKMTGTSMSTAIYAGKFIKEKYEKK